MDYSGCCDPPAYEISTAFFLLLIAGVSFLYEMHNGWVSTSVFFLHVYERRLSIQIYGVSFGGARQKFFFFFRRLTISNTLMYGWQYGS